MKTRYASVTLASVALALAINACGKKKTTTPQATAAAATNALAAAYPDGLALSAFPQEVPTAALALMSDAPTGDAGEPPKTMAGKMEEAQKMMKGEVDDCVPEILKTPPTDAQEAQTCYEFDHDMLYTAAMNGTTEVQAIGTKNGKNAAGEACLVAFGRERIDAVVSRVDRATASVQAMFCQVKKAGLASALPAVGEELNLASALQTGFSGKMRNITAATIKRLDDLDGRPLYKSTIAFGYANGATQEVNLVHSPKSETDNTDFNGTLWVKRSGSAGNYDDLMSIVYSRATQTDGTPLVKYALKNIVVNKTISDQFFTTAGDLDLNASTNTNGDYLKADGTVYSSANDAAAGIFYIAFEVNPLTNVGKMSYWRNPGGNYNEAARGFVFNIEAKSDGALKGCATSGAAAGVSIRKANKTSVALSPSGFWHPQLNGGSLNANGGEPYYSIGNLASPPLSHAAGATSQRWYVPTTPDAANNTAFASASQGSLITRQCFTQNATTGLYELDDEANSSSPAGYELITTGSTKFINPPQLQGVQVFNKEIKN